MENVEEIIDAISYEEVQQALDQLLAENSFSFAGCVEKIVRGEIPFSLDGMWEIIRETLFEGIIQDREMLVTLILLVLTGAILANFSELVQGKEVANMSYYVVYLLFFSIVFRGFIHLNQTAETTLTGMLDFMKVLAPTFFLSMTFSEGVTASGAYYQFVVVMITVVEYILVWVILPMIQMFFVLQMTNQFLEKDMFSKMAELIRDVIRFILKLLFGVMMGFEIIESLILPLTSEIEKSAVVKLSSGIPGVGGMASGMLSMVLCAGTLVKNAIGVVGIIGMLIFCGLPLLKLLLQKFVYQFLGAMLQPVSDQRIIRCFQAMSDTVLLLAYTVFVGSMMLVLSVALISMMTSIR